MNLPDLKETDINQLFFWQMDSQCVSSYYSLDVLEFKRTNSYSLFDTDWQEMTIGSMNLHFKDKGKFRRWPDLCYLKICLKPRALPMWPYELEWNIAQTTNANVKLKKNNKNGLI